MADAKFGWEDGSKKTEFDTSLNTKKVQLQNERVQMGKTKYFQRKRTRIKYTYLSLRGWIAKELKFPSSC